MERKQKNERHQRHYENLRRVDHRPIAKKGSSVPTPFSKKIKKSYKIPKIQKSVEILKENDGDDNEQVEIQNPETLIDPASDDDKTKKDSDQAKDSDGVMDESGAQSMDFDDSPDRRKLLQYDHSSKTFVSM